MTIKAIETHYAGHRFRSRLEARWAVFFDNAEIPWEYEPEGYETPTGNYLPDFRLQLCRREVIFEVKPESERPNLYRVCDGKDSVLLGFADDRWKHVAATFDFYVTYGLPRMSMNPSWSILWRDRHKKPSWGSSITAQGFSEDGHPPTGPCGEQNSLHRIRPSGEVEPFEFFCRCPACHAIEINHMGSMFNKNLSDDGVEWVTECCRTSWRYPMPMYCAGDEKLLRSYDAARMARFEHGETG